MNREPVYDPMLLIHFVSRAGSVLQLVYLLLISFFDTTTTGQPYTIRYVYDCSSVSNRKAFACRTLTQKCG